MIRACWRQLTVGALSLIPSLVLASSYNLPEFGEPADRSLPLFEERELGREVYRQILSYNLIIDDYELNGYVNRLGQLLVEANPEAQDQPFTFFVLRDGSINAFALPGGYIGIHTGLIRAAQSEAELAGVLAHEIAHVTQRHIARQMDATRGWDLASAALLIAAIAAGGSDPDLIQAAIGIGMTMSYQQSVNFTRAHELEADRLGINMLSAAGFNPVGMEDFFRRLAAQSRLYGQGIPELLRTHPYSTTRMAEARSRRTLLPDGPNSRTPLFELMRTRADLAEQNLTSDKAALYPNSSEATDLPTAYGQAIALREQGRHSEALSAARRALKQAEGDLQKETVELELARSLYEAKQIDQAIKILQSHHKRSQGNHAVTMQLARWQLETGEAARTRQMLLESEAFAADVPEVFHLLARAAGDMKDSAEVQYQMANWHLSRGDWIQAIRQLRTALRREEWDEYSEARLNGRLEGLLARAPERVRNELRRNPDGEGPPDNRSPFNETPSIAIRNRLN